MIYLKADSTNELTYVPTVDGSPVELPSPPTISFKDENGTPFVLNVTVSWDATNSYYSVTLSHLDITSYMLGQILSIKWTWSYEGNHLEDVVRALVVKDEYTQVFSALRRRAKDLGAIQRDRFIASGEKDFEVTYKPVGVGTEMVLVDGSVVNEADYFFDYEAGTLSFGSVQSGSVECQYKYYRHGENDLYEYVREALREVNALYGRAYEDYGLEELSDAQLELLTLMSLRNLYRTEMLSAARSAFSWSDEEKRVNRSGMVSGYADALEVLEEKITQRVSELKLSGITGSKLSGGTTPVDFDGIEGR